MKWVGSLSLTVRKATSGDSPKMCGRLLCQLLAMQIVSDTSLLSFIGNADPFIASSACNKGYFRIDLHDYIAVYSSTPALSSSFTTTAVALMPSWEEVTKFPCRTPDVGTVRWLTNQALLLTLDAPLTYLAALYTPHGEVIWLKLSGWLLIQFSLSSVARDLLRVWAHFGHKNLCGRSFHEGR